MYNLDIGITPNYLDSVLSPLCSLQLPKNNHLYYVKHHHGFDMQHPGYSISPNFQGQIGWLLRRS